MNESEVEEFLKSRGIANPLYKNFSRTGCYLCPKQNKASLYNLYKNYPKEWERAKELERIAKDRQCVTQTLKPNKSLLEFENEFKKNPSFDLSEDYGFDETCFCK